MNKSKKRSLAAKKAHVTRKINHLKDDWLIELEQLSGPCGCTPSQAKIRSNAARRAHITRKIKALGGSW